MTDDGVPPHDRTTAKPNPPPPPSGRKEPASDPLVSLREEIRALDREILRVAAQRVRVAREVGERKAASGIPIRNYEVEAEVLRAAEAESLRLGIDPRFGRELLGLSISEAVRVQEKDRHASSRRSARGEKALILGGRGNMGAWFAQFLDSRGYSVTVSDPAGPLEGYPYDTEPYAHLESYPLIVVATPPSVVGDVLGRLSKAPGLVIEIASLKSPFLTTLQAGLARGIRIVSIHPMWGPRAEMLADRNVVVCDAGNDELNEAGRALFRDTAARIVTVPIERHDALMAFTLGLPHALNLVFSKSLSMSPFSFDELRPLGGPTFQKQVGVAAEVASENRNLYYEIQRLNDHTLPMYRTLLQALESLESAIGDRATFVDFMAACQSYYGADVPVLLPRREGAGAGAGPTGGAGAAAGGGTGSPRSAQSANAGPARTSGAAQ